MQELRMRQKRLQKTDANSLASSFRNLGRMLSRPKALSVFRE